MRWLVPTQRKACTGQDKQTDLAEAGAVDPLRFVNNVNSSADVRRLRHLRTYMARPAEKEAA